MQKENTLDDLKTIAEIKELIARADKQSAERFWYPVIVAAGLLGAGAAFAKLFL